MNKRGLFGFIATVLILLIIGFFWFVKMRADSYDMCTTDEDCVKVQAGCCACNMGGEEKCVLKSEESDYLERLENCSANTFCAAFDNCVIESCGCVDGRCT